MHRLITRKCTPFEKFHSAFRNLVLLSLLRLDLDPWATSLGIRIRTNESGSAVCQFRVSLILRAEPSAIVPSSLKSIFCPLSYSLDSLWISCFFQVHFIPQCCGSGSSVGSECFWTSRIWSVIILDGSGSGFGSRSFHHTAKRVIKTLISTVLWLLNDVLSLKNDINVSSKSNKPKKTKK
jgi:hypothetical protein